MTLLFDALDAYLSPLLIKHAEGTPLIHNDLTSSWTAAQAVLKRDPSSPAHRLVSKRLDELHNSQLRAYQEAAQVSLKQYSETCPLEESWDASVAVGGNSSTALESLFVEKCKSKLIENKPAWHVAHVILEKCCLEPLLQRAKQYANEMLNKNEGPTTAIGTTNTTTATAEPSTQNEPTPTGDTTQSDAGEESGDHDEGDDPNDEEATAMEQEEQDDEKDGEEPTTTTTVATKKKKINLKKKVQLNRTKKVPIKKKTLRKTGAPTKTTTATPQRSVRGRGARNHKRGGAMAGGSGGRGASSTK